MPRSLAFLFGTLIAALVIGAPLCYSHYRQTQVRNLHIVRDGVLIRSGQMTKAGLKHVVNEYGVKTVIALRDGSTKPDQDEEKFCNDQEINYYRLRPLNWWAPDGPAPVEKNVKRFREIMANPDNYPVLIHCFAGVHRTGAYCAIYRMEHEYWSNEQAIAEMKKFGYINLDDEWDILGYLEGYTPTWKTK